MIDTGVDKTCNVREEGAQGAQIKYVRRKGTRARNTRRRIRCVRQEGA